MEPYLAASERNAIAAFADTAASELNAEIAKMGANICDPQHGIAYRIKSEDSIRRKLQGRKSTVSAPMELCDIVGIRVLCTCRNQVGAALEAVKSWEVRMELGRKSQKEYLQSAGEAGYSATHIHFLLQNERRLSLPKPVTVEVQVTTWLQHLHGMITHEMWYKRGDSEKTRPIKSKLERFAEQIMELEDEVSELLMPEGNSAR